VAGTAWPSSPWHEPIDKVRTTTRARAVRRRLISASADVMARNHRTRTSRSPTSGVEEWSPGATGGIERTGWLALRRTQASPDLEAPAHEGGTAPLG